MHANKVNTVITKDIGISRFSIFLSTVSGLIAEHTPKTINILNILEPTTLLTDISFAPSIAAVKLTASSGALVPKATIVSPMIRDGTFRFFATSELPSTNQSAPLTRAINPSIKINMLNNNLYIPPFCFSNIITLCR